MKKTNDLNADLLYDRYAKIESLARIGTWELLLPGGDIKWSDELYRILGYEVASFKPALANLLSVFEPEVADMIRDWMKRKSAREKKLRIEMQITSHTGLRKWVLAEADVIDEEKNGSLRIVGYVQDITHKKETELMLIENEHLFRSLFEESAIATAMVDKNGRLFKANKKMCSLMGYSLAEFTRLTFRDITYFLDLDISAEYFHRLMRNEISSYQIEKRYQRKDGSVFWGLLTISAVLDKEGKAKYMVGKIQDIDEAKKSATKALDLNIQLGASNRQKDQLFSIIAHDLRNPVWAIMQLLELTIRNEGQLSRPDLLKRIDILYKSASNIYELMDELLRWSSAQIRKPGFNPQKLNVQNMLEEAKSMVTVNAKNKEIEIICEACNDLYVMADLEMLRTILRNLLGNAIKFTRAKGAVTLSATDAGKFIEFCICDTGTGIKQENINKIFNADTNFTTFGTSGEKGTGLGLDICRDFVARHSGTIRVETVWGEGSKFFFTIPKAGSGTVSH